MRMLLVLERWQETCGGAKRVILFGLPNTSTSGVLS
jgi:hypothetical protein